MSADRPVYVQWVFRQFHPEFSGAGERFRRYVPGLSRRGIDATVHTTRPNMTLLPTAEREVMEDGLSVCRYEVNSEDPAGIDGLLVRSMGNVHGVRAGIPRNSVIQVLSTHPQLMKELLAKKMSSNAARPVLVGTMVEPDPLPASGLIKKLRRAVKMWMIRRTFSAVAVSSSVMARRFEKEGVSPSKIHIIGNGVDLERFSPIENQESKNELRTEFGLPQSAKVVLFVGNLIPRKGLDRLIEAWQLMSEEVVRHDYKLILLGGESRPDANDGETSASRTSFVEALKRAEASDPNQSVQIWNPGTPDYVAKVMRAADVFVFPTRKEGMGNVVLEAMSCGLPVVMTDFLGRPQTEFGRDGEHFTLTGETAADLAGTLSALLQQDTRRGEIGSAARKWASNQLGIEKSLDAYATLYGSLCA